MGSESPKNPEKKKKAWLRRIVAHHEAGHVVVAWFLKHAGKVDNVYVGLKMTRYGPTAMTHIVDVNKTDFDHLMAKLAILLAGPLCIEMTIGKSQGTLGCESDISEANFIAIDMVCKYGLSKKLGNKTFPKYNPFARGNYDQKTEAEIESESHELLKQAKKIASQILIDHQDKWDKLAEKILVKNCLKHAGIQKILGPRPKDALYK